MLLNEIFNSEYYDRINQDMEDPSPPETSDETSMQDFIITAFEVGEITYDEALNQLKKVTPKDQMFFWEHELSMADELKN